MSPSPQTLQAKQAQVGRFRMAADGDRREIDRLRAIIAQQTKLILQLTEELERLRG